MGRRDEGKVRKRMKKRRRQRWKGRERVLLHEIFNLFQSSCVWLWQNYTILLTSNSLCSSAHLLDLIIQHLRPSEDISLIPKIHEDAHNCFLNKKTRVDLLFQAMKIITLMPREIHSNTHALPTPCIHYNSNVKRYAAWCHAMRCFHLRPSSSP